MTAVPKHRLVVLMADDDEDDRMFAQDAFEESGLPYSLTFANDGEVLIDYLNRCLEPDESSRSLLPDLILLDLNMPRKDGREALREIKANPKLRHIPVVVLTTSSSQGDVYRSYDIGANSYITKPVTFDALVDVLNTLGKYWFSVVRLPREGYSNNAG
ncbi:response regulator [Altericista sp. CCNU0014]|uniref:response regulator n=1 Tax=Altericista sp. CCNU0014 TaxID=3082949 RepID=UPI00384BB0E2